MPDTPLMKNNRYYNSVEAARYIGVTRQAVAARFGDRYTTLGKFGARHQSRIPEPALIQWAAERHAEAVKLMASGKKSARPLSSEHGTP